MTVYALDHLQLAIPAGGENDARRFYVEALGLEEIPKPPHLAKRGGLWLRLGETQLHLGVENDFRAAKKAHPALLVLDLPALISKLGGFGYQIVRDQPLDGYDRVYTSDPFGNRIELMEKSS